MAIRRHRIRIHTRQAKGGLQTLNPSPVAQTQREKEDQGLVTPEPSIPFKVSDFTRVKNAALILETLTERGSNTKSSILLHTFNTSGRYLHLVDELIEIGAIDKIQLRGDRNWISVSSKGRQIVKHWRQFIATFNGGT